MQAKKAGKDLQERYTPSPKPEETGPEWPSDGTEHFLLGRDGVIQGRRNAENRVYGHTEEDKPSWKGSEDNLVGLITLKDLPRQTHQHYLPAFLPLEHGQASPFRQTPQIFKMEENENKRGGQ